MSATKDIFIASGGIKLEGCIWSPYDNSEATKSEIALLLHPHPLYGGSMHDGVLSVARSVFLERGMSACAFNLPGVGASEGRSSGDLSERDHVLAAVEYLSDEGYDITWGVGYSYGGALLTLSLAGFGVTARAILIAPALGLLNEQLASPVQPIHAVVGDKDPYSSVDQIKRHLPEATVRLITGADHFFSGSQGELGKAIEDSVDGA